MATRTGASCTATSSRRCEDPFGASRSTTRDSGCRRTPEGYGYTPAEHASVVSELVERLDLTDAIVMGQDWGGPIGMDVASRMPERVSGLVMGNTWYWPAKSRMFRAFSRVMSSPPAQWPIVQRNVFVRPLMSEMIKADLSAMEMAHYLDVVPTPESRRGIAEFPKQILAWRLAE